MTRPLHCHLIFPPTVRGQCTHHSLVGYGAQVEQKSQTKFLLWDLNLESLDWHPSMLTTIMDYNASLQRDKSKASIKTERNIQGEERCREGMEGDGKKFRRTKIYEGEKEDWKENDRVMESCMQRGGSAKQKEGGRD